MCQKDKKAYIFVESACFSVKDEILCQQIERAIRRLSVVSPVINVINLVRHHGETAFSGAAMLRAFIHGRKTYGN